MLVALQWIEIHWSSMRTLIHQTKRDLALQPATLCAELQTRITGIRMHLDKIEAEIQGRDIT